MSLAHDQPITVSELTLAIKLCLEPPFSHVFLKGEISNFKKQSSGHLYFSLKDSEAQISAVMFRGDASQLKRLPQEGDHISVKGEIKIYAPRGGYQIIIKELEYEGIGELLLKLEALKKTIHARGWFSAKYKKPLPKMPYTIGIVTSPTGAAIQDILHILSRRAGQVHVILNPVKVQGEGAALEIARAIDQFNQYGLVDVMIIGRGGGSIEDLWAFNEEIVAEAIFRSQIPIVCAVGHETDHTIAEYVADVRAPTPSVAAELVTAEKNTQRKHLDVIQQRVTQTGMHIVKHGRRRLETMLRQPMFTSPYAILGQKMQRFDDLRQEIEGEMAQSLSQKKLELHALERQLRALNPVTKIAHCKEQLASRSQMLFHHWYAYLQVQKNRVKQIAETLKAIDPKNLLKNGYSILFSEKTGSVINSVTSLNKGDEIRILLSDGEAKGEIQSISEHSQVETPYKKF